MFSLCKQDDLGLSPGAYGTKMRKLYVLVVSACGIQRQRSLGLAGQPIYLDQLEV